MELEEPTDQSGCFLTLIRFFFGGTMVLVLMLLMALAV